MQETRLVSKSLTLNYKRVPYVLDPTESARAARGKRVHIEERADGSLSFWHSEHELLATTFPKEHSVRTAEAVESKHLSATMEYVKARQRERVEAKAAEPSTSLREARLLRAGTPRWTRSGSLQKPGRVRENRTGHLYCGPAPRGEPKLEGP